jgi:hypothetical protein
VGVGHGDAALMSTMVLLMSGLFSDKMTRAHSWQGIA